MQVYSFIGFDDNLLNVLTGFLFDIGVNLRIGLILVLLHELSLFLFDFI